MFCFSIGLAMTMVMSGVMAALSVKHVSKRFKGFGNAFSRPTQSRFRIGPTLRGRMELHPFAHIPNGPIGNWIDGAVRIMR